MKRGRKRTLVARGLPTSESENIFITTNPRSTYRLGQACASLYPKGVIALFGDLGAGKTVFVKGFAQAMGVKNVRHEVVSPSFTLIREYEGRKPIYHIDLYRLESEAELTQLNLKEYLDKDGIVIIEWAEKALNLLPPERLEVHLQVVNKKKRKLEFKGTPVNIRKGLWIRE